MIIICPECSTKFNINPDRIPAGGTRVRCARCRSVFAVEKSPMEETPPEQPVLEGVSETTEDSHAEEAAAEEFSYERFQELDEKKEAEDFSFGAPDDAIAAKAGMPLEEPEEDDFTFSEPTHETNTDIPKEPETAGDDQFEPSGISQSVASEASKAAAKSLSEDQASEAESEQLYQHLPEKKSSPFGAAIRILLLLILAVLVAVGVFVYINGPDKLNETIQQLLGQQVSAPEQSGQITLANLEGKFLENQYVGEVFLIRGEAINNYPKARSAIQVKGIIFDQGGQPLLQKTVFCGNPISDSELKELPFAELEKMMGNQFGKDLSNMKVNAKQSIPFDIVFRDLPKNLSEFSVNVTASKSVTN